MKNGEERSWKCHKSVTEAPQFFFFFLLFLTNFSEICLLRMLNLSLQPPMPIYSKMGGGGCNTARPGELVASPWSFLMGPGGPDSWGMPTNWPFCPHFEYFAHFLLKHHKILRIAQQLVLSSSTRLAKIHMLTNNCPRTKLGYDTYQQGPKHYNSIVIPPFNNKLWKLKPALLSLIGSHPFIGMDHQDSYTHLSTFLELCSTMGAFGKDAKVVYLKAFPFSLAGKAKTWLQSHLNKCLNAWEEVVENIIARFFPLSRFIRIHCYFFPRIWWTSLWNMGEIQVFVAEVPKP